MSKRKYGEYLTLKEARAAAREDSYYGVVPIYKEPDGSFSIREPFHKKAKIVCGVDKSGARYELVWKRDYSGKRVQIFEKLKKERG